MLVEPYLAISLMQRVIGMPVKDLGKVDFPIYLLSLAQK